MSKTSKKTQVRVGQVWQVRDRRFVVESVPTEPNRTMVTMREIWRGDEYRAEAKRIVDNQPVALRAEVSAIMDAPQVMDVDLLWFDLRTDIASLYAEAQA